MRLQIAVDLADTKKILEIADKIYDVIDIFEVGTPVIMKEGMTPVKALKQKYPDLTVLADSKIVDGGAIEAQDICESGADILTVLALSDNETIEEVIKTAHRLGRKVMTDLICVKDIAGRARQLLDLGADYISVHTGVDMQKSGRTPLKDLQELTAAIPPQKAAAAGGIHLSTIEAYAKERPEIIIAGSSLCQAPDIRQAVLAMKEKMS